MEGQVLHNPSPDEGLSPRKYGGTVEAQDSLYLPLGTLSMLPHAILVNKHPSNIPEIDEQIVQW